jgi:ABC-type multidrug transport system fused ATPase/permease subunit
MPSMGDGIINPDFSTSIEYIPLLIASINPLLINLLPGAVPVYNPNPVIVFSPQKERLPEMLWQLSASVGAMIALFFYDYRIGLVCLAVIGPLAYINNISRKNVSHLEKDIHDNQEELYKLIENRDTSKIHQFYYNMVSPRISIARWNAFSYSTIKVFLIIIFIVVLFICVDLDNFTTGKIYSIVAYLWTFIGQTDYLPDLMESLGSIKDLNVIFNKDEIISNQPIISDLTI